MDIFESMKLTIRRHKITAIPLAIICAILFFAAVITQINGAYKVIQEWRIQLQTKD